MLKKVTGDKGLGSASAAVSPPGGTGPNTVAKLRITPEGGLCLVGDSDVLQTKDGSSNGQQQQQQKQQFFATRAPDGKWNLLMAPTSDPSRLFLVQPAAGQRFQVAGNQSGTPNVKVVASGSAETALAASSPRNGSSGNRPPGSVLDVIPSGSSAGITCSPKTVALPVAQLRAVSGSSPFVSPSPSTSTTTVSSSHSRPREFFKSSESRCHRIRPMNPFDIKRPSMFKSRGNKKSPKQKNCPSGSYSKKGKKDSPRLALAVKGSNSTVVRLDLENDSGDGQMKKGDKGGVSQTVGFSAEFRKKTSASITPCSSASITTATTTATTTITTTTAAITGDTSSFAVATTTTSTSQSNFSSSPTTKVNVPDNTELSPTIRPDRQSPKQERETSCEHKDGESHDALLSSRDALKSSTDASRCRNDAPAALFGSTDDPPAASRGSDDTHHGTEDSDDEDEAWSPADAPAPSSSDEEQEDERRALHNTEFLRSSAHNEERQETAVERDETGNTADSSLSATENTVNNLHTGDSVRSQDDSTMSQGADSAYVSSVQSSHRDTDSAGLDSPKTVVIDKASTSESDTTVTRQTDEKAALSEDEERREDVTGGGNITHGITDSDRHLNDEARPVSKTVHATDDVVPCADHGGNAEGSDADDTDTYFSDPDYTPNHPSTARSTVHAKDIDFDHETLSQDTLISMDSEACKASTGSITANETVSEQGYCTFVPKRKMCDMPSPSFTDSVSKNTSDGVNDGADVDSLETSLCELGGERRLCLKLAKPKSRKSQTGKHHTWLSTVGIGDAELTDKEETNSRALNKKPFAESRFSQSPIESATVTESMVEEQSMSSACDPDQSQHNFTEENNDASATGTGDKDRFHAPILVSEKGEKKKKKKKKKKHRAGEIESETTDFTGSETEHRDKSDAALDSELQIRHNSTSGKKARRRSPRISSVLGPETAANKSYREISPAASDEESDVSYVSPIVSNKWPRITSDDDFETCDTKVADKPKKKKNKVKKLIISFGDKTKTADYDTEPTKIVSATLVETTNATSAETPNTTSFETPSNTLVKTTNSTSADTPDAASAHTPDAASAHTPDAASAHTPDAASAETPNAASAETTNATSASADTPSTSLVNAVTAPAVEIISTVSVETTDTPLDRTVATPAHLTAGTPAAEPKKKKEKKKKGAQNSTAELTDPALSLFSDALSPGTIIDASTERTNNPLTALKKNKKENEKKTRHYSRLPGDTRTTETPETVSFETTDAISVAATDSSAADTSNTPHKKTADTLYIASTETANSPAVASKMKRKKKEKNSKKATITSGILETDTSTIGLPDTSNLDVTPLSIVRRRATRPPIIEDSDTESVSSQFTEPVHQDLTYVNTLSQKELRELCSPGFVVLERLTERDIFFLSRRFRAARANARSRCTGHCRQRTVSYLCQLKLIDCCSHKPPTRLLEPVVDTPNELSKEIVSEVPSSSEPGTDSQVTEETARKRKRRERSDKGKKRRKKGTEGETTETAGTSEDVVILPDEVASNKQNEGQKEHTYASRLATETGRSVAVVGPGKRVLKVVTPSVSAASDATPSSRVITVPKGSNFVPLASLPALSSGARLLAVPASGALSTATRVITIPSVSASTAGVSSSTRIIIPPAASSSGSSMPRLIPVSLSQTSTLKDTTRASLQQALSRASGGQLSKAPVPLPKNSRIIIATPPTCGTTSTTSATVLGTQIVTIPASSVPAVSVSVSGGTAPPPSALPATPVIAGGRQFFMVQIGGRSVLVPVSNVSSASGTTTTVSAPTISLINSSASTLSVPGTTRALPVVSVASSAVRAALTTSVSAAGYVPGSVAKVVMAASRPRAPAPTTPTNRPTASAILFQNRGAVRPNQAWTGPQTINVGENRVLVLPGGVRLSTTASSTGGTPRFNVISSRGSTIITARPTSSTSLLKVTPAGPRLMLPTKRGSHLTEEQRRAKRAKLEKKYPLPPGVVIKTEPVTSGFPEVGLTSQAGSSGTSVTSSTYRLLTNADRSVTAVRVLSSSGGQANRTTAIGPTVYRVSPPPGAVLVNTPRGSQTAPSTAGVTVTSTAVSAISLLTPSTGSTVIASSSVPSLTSTVPATTTNTRSVSLLATTSGATASESTLVSSRSRPVTSALSATIAATISSVFQSASTPACGTSSVTESSDDVIMIDDASPPPSPTARVAPSSAVVDRSATVPETPVTRTETPTAVSEAFATSATIELQSVASPAPSESPARRPLSLPVPSTGTPSSAPGGTPTHTTERTSTPTNAERTFTPAERTPTPTTERTSTAINTPTPSSTPATRSATSTPISLSTSRLASLGAMLARQAAESPDSLLQIDTGSLQSERGKRLREMLARQIEKFDDATRRRALQVLAKRFGAGGGGEESTPSPTEQSREGSEERNAS